MPVFVIGRPQPPSFNPDTLYVVSCAELQSTGYIQPNRWLVQLMQDKQSISVEGEITEYGWLRIKGLARKEDEDNPRPPTQTGKTSANEDGQGETPKPEGVNS